MNEPCGVTVSTEEPACLATSVIVVGLAENVNVGAPVTIRLNDVETVAVPEEELGIEKSGGEGGINIHRLRFAMNSGKFLL